MTRAARPRPSETELIATRIRAALANNPRISPRQLAEQTGCSLGQAIAALEGRR
jgi:hypothetical protein